MPTEEHYPAIMDKYGITCSCQRLFLTAELFHDHLIENCAHTDVVRWDPKQKKYVCEVCTELGAA